VKSKLPLERNWNDLVAEYNLHVYPLAVGGGKRLFPEGKRLNLKLMQSTALPAGVLYQRYERQTP
jgi:dihydrofolate reductase